MIIFWDILSCIGTILYYLLLLALLLLSIMVYKVFIKPLLHLYYYKRQGLQTTFFPIVGYGKLAMEDFSKHQDTLYRWKQPNAVPKIFTANIADYVQIILSDRELVKQFCLQQDKYIKFPAFSDLAKVIMGEGTLLAEGQAWKRHRKLTSAAFNYDYFKDMVPEIIDIAEELWEKIYKEGTYINFMVKAQMITGEVVGRLFFGEKFSQYEFNGVPVADYITELMAVAMVEQSSIFSFLFTSKAVKLGLLKRHRKLLSNVRQFREFMLKLATERLKDTIAASKTGSPKKKRNNLIDLFYNQRLKNPEDAFTDEEIVNEFITFFVAGMDTTGHLITMMSYHYLKESHCQSKVMAEVEKYFANPSKVTIDDLNQMNYMTAMAKETLRMSPSLPFFVLRQAVADHKIGDIKVRAGTLVNVSLLALNYNPDFHEDPQEFKPERWLDENSKTRHSIEETPYTYVPFSTGSRSCLGQHLALIEAKVIFGLFLKKFNFSYYGSFKLRLSRRFLYEPQNALMYELNRKTNTEKSGVNGSAAKDNDIIPE